MYGSWNEWRLPRSSDAHFDARYGQDRTDRDRRLNARIALDSHWSRPQGSFNSARSRHESNSSRGIAKPPPPPRSWSRTEHADSDEERERVKKQKTADLEKNKLSALTEEDKSSSIKELLDKEETEPRSESSDEKESKRIAHVPKRHSHKHRKHTRDKRKTKDSSPLSMPISEVATMESRKVSTRPPPLTLSEKLKVMAQTSGHKDRASEKIEKTKVEMLNMYTQTKAPLRMNRGTQFPFEAKSFTCHSTQTSNDNVRSFSSQTDNAPTVSLATVQVQTESLLSDSKFTQTAPAPKTAEKEVQNANTMSTRGQQVNRSYFTSNKYSQTSKSNSTSKSKKSTPTNTSRVNDDSGVLIKEIAGTALSDEYKKFVNEIEATCESSPIRAHLVKHLLPVLNGAFKSMYSLYSVYDGVGSDCHKKENDTLDLNVSRKSSHKERTSSPSTSQKNQKKELPVGDRGKLSSQKEHSNSPSAASVRSSSSGVSSRVISKVNRKTLPKEASKKKRDVTPVKTPPLIVEEPKKEEPVIRVHKRERSLSERSETSTSSKPKKKMVAVKEKPKLRLGVKRPCRASKKTEPYKHDYTDDESQDVSSEKVQARKEPAVGKRKGNRDEDEIPKLTTEPEPSFSGGVDAPPVERSLCETSDFSTPSKPKKKMVAVKEKPKSRLGVNRPYQASKKTVPSKHDYTDDESQDVSSGKVQTRNKPAVGKRKGNRDEDVIPKLTTEPEPSFSGGVDAPPVERSLCETSDFSTSSKPKKKMVAVKEKPKSRLGVNRPYQASKKTVPSKHDYTDDESQDVSSGKVQTRNKPAVGERKGNRDDGVIPKLTTEPEPSSSGVVDAPPVRSDQWYRNAYSLKSCRVTIERLPKTYDDTGLGRLCQRRRRSSSSSSDHSEKLDRPPTPNWFEPSEDAEVVTAGGGGSDGGNGALTTSDLTFSDFPAMKQMTPAAPILFQAHSKLDRPPTPNWCEPSEDAEVVTAGGGGSDGGNGALTTSDLPFSDSPAMKQMTPAAPILFQAHSKLDRPPTPNWCEPSEDAEVVTAGGGGSDGGNGALTTSDLTFSDFPAMKQMTPAAPILFQAHSKLDQPPTPNWCEPNEDAEVVTAGGGGSDGGNGALTTSDLPFSDSPAMKQRTPAAPILFQAHQGLVLDMKISENHLLVVASQDSGVLCYSLKNGKRKRFYKTKSEVVCVSVLSRKEGDVVYCACADQMIRAFSVKTSELIRSSEPLGTPRCMDCSGSYGRERIFLGLDTGECVLLDPRTLKALRVLRGSTGVVSLLPAIIDENQVVIVSSDDRRLTIRNFNAIDLLQKLEWDFVKPAQRLIYHQGHLYCTAGLPFVVEYSFNERTGWSAPQKIVMPDNAIGVCVLQHHLLVSIVSKCVVLLNLEQRNAVVGYIGNDGNIAAVNLYKKRIICAYDDGRISSRLLPVEIRRVMWS